MIDFNAIKVTYQRIHQKKCFYLADNYSSVDKVCEDVPIIVRFIGSSLRISNFKCNASNKCSLNNMKIVYFNGV